ncbi:hypothetical protein SAMN04488134_10919 [Amphibacillus marinus]|uniref:Uncharacterized protein n=1 Tax=Amphibacillus marinus TaxID=872970 RepID=A0A1H8QS54_9BACI|nr:hypothetical protein [Amphibacillus marinus]SEO56644.1 hypothetical protein SAMN04488134_10919 [Amphibacillus marinus]
MTYFIFALSLLTIVLSGIWLVRQFRKRYQPNRWLVGFIGPLILILPLIFTPNLPNFLWVGLITLFCWTNIYFFETTRMLLETGKIKTGFKSSQVTK